MNNTTIIITTRAPFEKVGSILEWNKDLEQPMPVQAIPYYVDIPKSFENVVAALQADGMPISYKELLNKTSSRLVYFMNEMLKTKDINQLYDSELLVYKEKLPHRNKMMRIESGDNNIIALPYPPKEQTDIKEWCNLLLNIAKDANKDTSHVRLILHWGDIKETDANKYSFKDKIGLPDFCIDQSIVEKIISKDAIKKIFQRDVHVEIVFFHHQPTSIVYKYLTSKKKDENVSAFQYLMNAVYKVSILPKLLECIDDYPFKRPNPSSDEIRLLERALHANSDTLFDHPLNLTEDVDHNITEIINFIKQYDNAHS